MLYLGMAATLVLSGFYRPLLAKWGPAVLLGTAIVTLAMSAPLWYSRWPRAFRDALRFALGGVIALCCWMPLLGHWAHGLLVAGVLAAFWRWYLRQRGGRKTRCCDGCKELAQDGICSGFSRQAERIRRYEEEATDVLTSAGHRPNLPGRA